MPALLEYLVKTAICLAVVYLFYWLLLKRMTYYTWNRYFLLSYAVLSLIVPFVNINLLVPSHAGKAVFFINQLPALSPISTAVTPASASGHFSLPVFILMLFFGGVFILFCRLMVQLFSLKKLKERAVLLQDGSVKLYHLPLPILPFSFLDSIYLNKDQYSEGELYKIIQHERVHVEQKHTTDVLVADVICMLNWFNPFAWLIRKAIRENLEFIADEAVIENGVDQKNYQYLLLKVTGKGASGLITYLNFSSLKNRIYMMNKQRTARLHLLKFTLLLPLIIVLLAAFRSKYENGQAAKDQTASTGAFTLSSLTYFIPDSKVAAIVQGEQENSVLRTGAPFNLTLVSTEEARLKQLLARNGYTHIDKHAITFLIDSSAVNTSFSVQVNITVGQQKLQSNRTGLEQTGELNLSDHQTAYSTTTKSAVEPATGLNEAKIITSNPAISSGNSNLMRK